MIQGLAMIGLGVAACTWWQRRSGVTWPWFAIGAGAWFAAVALKLLWAGATIGPVSRVLVALLGDTAGRIATWCYVGALTGVCNGAG